MHYERTGRMRVRKYLRKSCYHCIKCSAANFPTAFMWRRPLISAVLATTTHRKPKKMYDGTSTQVVDQMINKSRIKIVQEEPYNIGDPPWIKEEGKREKITIASIIDFVIKSERNI